MLPSSPPLTACADAPGAYRNRRSAAANAVNQRFVIFFLRNLTQPDVTRVVTRLPCGKSSGFFRLPRRVVPSCHTGEWFGSRFSTSPPSLREAQRRRRFGTRVDLARQAERLGFTALLARGASQHARHRQRGNRGRDRPRGRRHHHHPGRRRRHHAAEPRAARRSRSSSGRSSRSFPGRIDLGLGRAPGTDPATARALRRNAASRSGPFPQDVLELMAIWPPAEDRRFARSRARAAGADLHPGLEPVRRPASPLRSACRSPSPRISRPRR